jgi:hypothetical protein
MQLAPMRYTKIEGTAVAVSVTSTAEAKAALKELRHKKRELKFLRTALVRRQKAARTKQNAGTSKPRRSWLRRFFAGVGWLIAWLFEVATVARAERRARDPAEIERELQRIDETLHNIEGCTLQLQGKMLTLG